MYGLVNKAIQQLVVANFGEEKWEVIKQEAQFEDVGFVSMKPYSDNLTFGLVAAASKHTGLAVPELLKAFGEYWVLHTSQEGYGEMMDSAGNSLPEFLRGLNMMHFRLGNIMPEMVMPHFEVTDETSNSLLLHYKSKRDGLSDMVIGLVQGLGKRFNTKCAAELVQSKAAGAEHDVFKVTWK
jgi:hypothetical protein